MKTRLFVGGLPYNLTQEELKAIFEKIGPVGTCDVIKDKLTGQSKGFAFVEMTNDIDANKAIKELNGTEINERNITVNVAKPREESGKRF